MTYPQLCLSRHLDLYTRRQPSIPVIFHGSERISTISSNLATSEVQTVSGRRPCSWYAGPGRQPAGEDPPPNRPVLVIVDYTALQDLSHDSEANSATFRALRPGNFRYTLRMGNTKPSSPGLSNTHRRWHQPCPLETCVWAFAIAFGTSGTFAWKLLTLSFAIDLDGDVFQVYPMTPPSCDCWRSIDLSGAQNSIAF